MKFISKFSHFSHLAMGLYYKYTAYVPRKMPTTVEEYKKFESLMLTYYKLDNNPAVIATIAAHIGSHPAKCIRIQYGYLANTAKRLTINKIAHDHKMLAVRQHDDRLKIVDTETTSEIIS